MNGSPSPHDYGLLTAEQIDALQPGARDADALQVTLQWVREFIAQPHPLRDLSKADSPAAVCPFMPGSLEKGLTWLIVPSCPIERADDVASATEQFRLRIKELDPVTGRDASFKTIILVFPTITAGQAPAFIDGVHQQIAEKFKQDGLMLGEFHADNQKVGAYNPEFFPLQSPVPLMAIRLMVARDRVFLLQDTGSPEANLANLKAYANALPNMPSLPAGMDEVVQELRERIERLERMALETPED